MNNLDMSNMSPMEITQIFSCMYGNNKLVWEELEDKSIQIYTMKWPHIDIKKYPDSFEMEEELPTYLIDPDHKKGWGVWESLEVYSMNLKNNSKDYNELLKEYPDNKIKKGLL